jgi:hypothetical protein
MVREIRVPSSSNSSSVEDRWVSIHERLSGGDSQLTDGDGLDADTLLDVSVFSIVGILALQNLLAAESVDEGCAT